MRRFFSCAITVLALGGFSLLGYLGVQAWLETSGGSSAVSTPVVGIKNYQLPNFIGEIDNSGYDVSFPQCHQELSQRFVGFSIIGLNNGRPYTTNPCFAKQWEWANTHSARAIYINVSDPGSGPARARGGAIAKDTLAQIKTFNIAKNVPIWLDIELNNDWTNANRSIVVLNEVMRILHKRGHPVGIYSVPVHWFSITLSADVSVPTWLALGKYSDIAKGVADAKRACTRTNFGGRKPAIVQFVGKTGDIWTDRNILCDSPAGLVARP